MEKRSESVLRAWWLTELLQMPTIDDKDSSITHIQREGDGRLPWDVKKTTKGEGYYLFLGLTPLKHVMVYIRDAFGSNEEFHKYTTEKTFLALIKVSADGRFELDSLQLPYMSGLLGKLGKSKDFYDSYQEEFENTHQDLKTLFNEQFSGEGVSIHTIQSMLGVLVDALEYPESLLVNPEQGHLFESVVKKLKKNEMPYFMNSFYAEDLKKVLDKGLGSAALKQYISGNEDKTDINEARVHLEKWLHPQYMSPVRWPAPDEHLLTTMQQVAVNVVLHDEQALHSVNGPPGTGKTTLLKDLFAANIYKRAKAMTVFKYPNQAFSTLESESKNWKSYVPHQSIASYGMVVASSNNNAVENISKELPERTQVMREDTENEKELALAEVASELDYFPQLADAVMGKDKPDEGEPESWGLFSVPLGNSTKKQEFNQHFRWGKEHQTIDDYLYGSEPYSLDDWEEAKRDLKKLEDQVEKKREELTLAASLLPDRDKFNQELQELVREQEINQYMVADLQQEIEISDLKQKKTEELSSLVAPSGLWWISAKGRQQKREMDEHKAQLYDLKKEQYAKKEVLAVEVAKQKELQLQIEDLSKNMSDIEELFKKLKAEGVTIPDEAYWNGDYETRQKHVPWLSAELNHLRSKLFLQSMKVHKVFLYLAKNQVMSNLNVFFNEGKYDSNFKEDRDYIKAGWQTLFLIVPVISTTFASVANMFKNIGAEEIGYAYIDEAGQALPQAAVGLMYRSKHVVAVGDPLQIEPVITMPETLLRDIAQYYDVSATYLSLESSVQSVADAANAIGAYIDKKNEKWIGIPLWVHRRCANPMFTMANSIAYRGKMVLANDKQSEASRWVDVVGRTRGSNYVPQEGKEVVKLVKEAFSLVSEGEPLPSLYIITPFKAVKDELIREIKRGAQDYAYATGRSKREINFWVYQNVGTVHTFQGKEADTVILVLGTDASKQGAAKWIIEKPNLINVAITRAKRDLIVVGDWKRLSKLDHLDVVARELAES